MKFIFVSILFGLFFSYYTQSFLVTENQIHHFYSTQLSYEQIESLLTQQKKWNWLGYFLSPIIYLLKIATVSFCIYTGLFIIVGNDVSISKTITSVAKADLIFLIPNIIKMVWFSIQIDYSILDFQYFMPGSLLSLFNPLLVEPWLIYPLISLNLFEVVFWFIIAYELKGYFKKDFSKSFQTVVLSYGSGFIIWILFVVFMTINFS